MTKKTKVQSVIDLCKRKSGTTLESIVKLGVSKIAAQSLIGDARRKGVKVKYEDGRYYA